jgi:hypothetical protein
MDGFLARKKTYLQRFYYKFFLLIFYLIRINSTIKSARFQINLLGWLEFNLYDAHS